MRKFLVNFWPNIQVHTPPEVARFHSARFLTRREFGAWEVPRFRRPNICISKCNASKWCHEFGRWMGFEQKVTKLTKARRQTSDWKTRPRLSTGDRRGNRGGSGLWTTRPRVTFVAGSCR